MDHSYYWLPQVFQTTSEVFFPSSKENVLTGCVHDSASKSTTVLESEKLPLPQPKLLQEHDSSNGGFSGNSHQAFTHKNKPITFIFPWPFNSHKQPWNIPTTTTTCEELRSAAVLKHRPRNTWASLRLPQGQTEALTSSRGELTADPIQSVIIAGITKPSGLSVLLVFTSNKFH